MDSCENRFELLVDLCEISAVLKDMRLMYLLAEKYGVVPLESMIDSMFGIDDIIGDTNRELLSKLLSRYSGKKANYMIEEIIALIEKI